LQALFQGKNADWKKKGAESMMGEDSVLERVTAAAEERQPSHNSVIAYRRTWLKIIAWAAEGLVLESYAAERKRHCGQSNQAANVRELTRLK
jgi:hypothetical protein